MLNKRELGAWLWLLAALLWAIGVWMVIGGLNAA